MFRTLACLVLLFSFSFGFAQTVSTISSQSTSTATLAFRSLSAQCTVAQPFALGENPKIWGERVLYSYREPVGWMQQAVQRLGLHLLNSQTTIYPIFPAANPAQDIVYSISGDTIAFLRYGGSTEIHIASLLPPNQQVVLQSRSNLPLGMPALFHLSAGAEYNLPNPNDFVVNWTENNYPSPGTTLHWCRTQDCFQYITQTSLPASMTGFTGTLPGESIVMASASTTPNAYAAGDPSFLYMASSPNPGPLTTPLFSWIMAMPGTAYPFTGTFPAAAPPLSGVQWNGDLVALGHLNQVEITLPYIPASVPLFQSQPPAGFRDFAGTVPNTVSTLGMPLIAFLRSPINTPNTRQVMATFYNGTNTQAPVEIQMPGTGWTECSPPATSGNRVVFSCKNVGITYSPILFASTCN